MEDDFKKIGRRMGNIEDLPEELKSELQACKTDALEDQIIHVINDLYKGMANIDEILVGLYRKFKSMQKRPFLISRLYRMMRSGVIFSVKKKKGVYTTKKELENFYAKE